MATAIILLSVIIALLAIPLLAYLLRSRRSGWQVVNEPLPAGGASPAVTEFIELASQTAMHCPTWESELPSHLEPHLVRMLELVKSHPDQREQLAQCFNRIVWSQAQGSWQIVQFCMLELRWEEVQQAAQKRMKRDPDIRVRRIMERILAAFSPDWPEAVRWDYFGKSKGSGR